MTARSFWMAVGVAAMSGTLACGATAATVTFNDSIFNSTDYTTAFEVLSDPSNTFSLSQCATCGDPGSALELSIGFPTGGGAYNTNNFFGVINTTFVYDPATQGAISTIDASVAKNFSINSAVPYGNSFRPLIEQDGNYYAAVISGPVLQGPGSTGFNTLSATGLTASSFLQFDPTTGTFGSAHPNFAGDTMEFGLQQLLGASAVPGFSAEAVYDNLSLTLNAAVPEPATWAMMLVGFGGLGAALRGRRRAAASV
jgi:hypothetical protein